MCFTLSGLRGFGQMMRFRARLHVHAAPLRPRATRLRDSASTTVAHAAAHAAMVGEAQRKGPLLAGLLAANVLPTKRKVLECNPFDRACTADLGVGYA